MVRSMMMVRKVGDCNCLLLASSVAAGVVAASLSKSSVCQSFHP